MAHLFLTYEKSPIVKIRPNEPVWHKGITGVVNNNAKVSIREDMKFTEQCVVVQAMLRKAVNPFEVFSSSTQEHFETTKQQNYKKIIVQIPKIIVFSRYDCRLKNITFKSFVLNYYSFIYC